MSVALVYETTFIKISDKSTQLKKFMYQIVEVILQVRPVRRHRAATENIKTLRFHHGLFSAQN